MMGTFEEKLTYDIDLQTEEFLSSNGLVCKLRSDYELIKKLF